MKHHLLCLVLGLAVAGCATTSANEPKRTLDKAEGAALRKQLAYSLAAHREWAAASRPLLELRAERPNDPEIHTLLGTVYREQGLFEQAEISYQRAINLNAKSAKAHVGLGILREVRGDRGDAAVESFRTAISLVPEDAGYHNNLGFALFVRGRYGEAERELQEALRYDPLSRRTRNNLGFVYARLRQFDRAKREFEHGGSEDEVQNNLGYMYEQAGDKASACAHYREAAAQNPLLRTATVNVHRVCGEPFSERPSAAAPSEERSPELATNSDRTIGRQP